MKKQIDYYPNGKIYQEYFIDSNGHRQGLFKIYHPNGQLRSEFVFKDNVQIDQTIESFDENGKMVRSVTFANRALNGPFKEFYETGSIKLIGEYENNRIINRKDFDKDGNVLYLNACHRLLKHPGFEAKILKVDWINGIETLYSSEMPLIIDTAKYNTFKNKFPDSEILSNRYNHISIFSKSEHFIKELSLELMMLNGGYHSFKDLPEEEENKKSNLIFKANSLLLFHLEFFKKAEDNPYLLTIYYLNENRDNNFTNGELSNYDKSSEGYGLYKYSDYVRLCVPNLKSEVVNFGEGPGPNRFFVVPNEGNTHISCWSNDWKSISEDYLLLIIGDEEKLTKLKNAKFFKEHRKKQKESLLAGDYSSEEFDVYNITLSKGTSFWRIDIYIKEEEEDFLHHKHPYENIFPKEELNLETTQIGPYKVKRLKASNGLFGEVYYQNQNGDIEVFSEKELIVIDDKSTNLFDINLWQSYNDEIEQEFKIRQIYRYLNSNSSQCFIYQRWFLNYMSYIYRGLDDQINSFYSIYKAFHMSNDAPSYIIDTYGEACEAEGHFKISLNLYKRAVKLDESNGKFKESHLVNYIQMASKLGNIENLKEGIELLETHFGNNSKISEYKKELSKLRGN